MRPEPAQVALLAPPGPLRDGLQALLAALPAVRLAAVLDSLGQAGPALRAAPPDLIVLDAAFASAGLAEALATLRAAAPACACLVLAEEAPAVDGHGTVVLVKGAPAAELVAAVERLSKGGRMKVNPTTDDS